MPDVEFFGEKFRLADEISDFALMEFAETAEAVEEDSVPALAAVYRLLKAAVAADDWPRFQQLARARRAMTEDLLPVVVAVFQGATGRPTGLPSDSSDGQPPTSTSSAADSSSPVMPRRLAGRPDLQLMVAMAQESRSA